MNEERTRILKLVQEGKLTVEQADLLISELERRTPRDGRFRNPLGNFEKPKLDDLKQIGTQVSSAVTQSLSEVRRQLEQQFENWNIGPNLMTLSASTEVNLPDTIRMISVETRNGRIQVTSWDEASIRIHIRGQVKTENLNEAKRMLEAALQTEQTDESYQLIIAHGQKDSVSSANIDVYVPRQFAKLLCKTNNGSVHADTLDATELVLDSENGNVWVHDAEVERMRLVVENGSIEIQNSISARSRSVYTSAKNGRIMIDGIAREVHCVGTAKTVNGKIQITGDQMAAEYEESTRPTHARFEQPGTPADEQSERETHIYCETKNGAIRIRA